MLRQRISHKLIKKQQQFLMRERLSVELLENNNCIVNGKACIQFCNNDYLGLSKHPDIKKAVISAVNTFGVGATASPLIVGFSKQHQQLEEEIAEFVGQKRALIFSSGYAANLALISTLTSKDDFIFADKLNHASLIDACRFSHAASKRYKHSDMAQLEVFLEQNKAAHQFIVSDSVFSMQGDIAAIDKLSMLAKNYNASLILDDSHGIGVLGKNGNGVAESFFSEAKKPILTAGFGKAFGCSGGFIAGDTDEIETIIQQGRHYIYSTAISPIIISALKASLKIIQKEIWRRQKLNMLIQFFKEQARALNLPVTPSVTAIQPLILGDAKRVIELEQFLLQKGILVRAIRPPSVPANQSLLRIVLTVTHTPTQIEQLLDALQLWFKQHD